MSRPNEIRGLPIPLPFFIPFADARRARLRANASTSSSKEIRIAASGQNYGRGYYLADARRASLSRLLDQDRTTWFVDVDPNGPKPAA